MTAFDSALGWLTARPIAHRGLHDGNVAVPENSLPAALAAIAAGYAIECDVQLSADGTPFIFHDHTLARLTGRDADFRALDDAAIGELRLAGTEAHIPTVADFLAAIAGQVPVVMELKGIGPDEDEDYFARLHPILAGYSGDLALMSFDPWLIDQMLAARPGRPIGLTATGAEPADFAAHRRVYQRGCDFSSYDIHHLPNPFTEWVRGNGAPLISWTVRTQAQIRHSQAHCDQMTFEGIAPQQ
ncbi:glycerophosphodiester phosphodiesterase family protein [Aurantimonas sp. A2-1-M11]|uniref:glycerophosphodiester phosphodiesterase family protein n=1 Tax=Aurantimonas sp. A2-1-M11 TaxID=3113712 RepID=UPI002F956F00